MILQEILENTKKTVGQKKMALSLARLKDKVAQAQLGKVRDFQQALMLTDSLAIIGEIKKASPSKGLIRPDFDPVSLAREYGNANVQALSVLTEERYFKGHPDFLSQVKQAIGMPLLRKDFIVDEWQIYESRLIGADAILLIVAALQDHELSLFLKTAGEIGMHCLVEVHSKEEMERAARLEARIIGINNRDLKTFSVRLETTMELAANAPSHALLVSESGIATRAHMEQLGKAGVRAVLIGETFMRASSIEEKVRELRGLHG